MVFGVYINLTIINFIEWILYAQFSEVAFKARFYIKLVYDFAVLNERVVYYAYPEK